jgi:hypothetical protein
MAGESEVCCHPSRRASSCVARRATAGTGVGRPLAVAVIGVEALLDGEGGQAERLAPDRLLARWQEGFAAVAEAGHSGAGAHFSDVGELGDQLIALEDQGTEI